MSRPIHFEIHAGDPARVQAFYEALFGWSFQRWGEQDYWIIKTGEGQPGIDGGMVRRMGDTPAIDAPTPVIAYVCTVGVESLDASLEKAVALGGTLALAKMPIPGVGWLAYVKDPDGNIFGMMQADPSASM